MGSDDPFDHPQPHPEAEFCLFRCSVAGARYPSEDLLKYARTQYEREHGPANLTLMPAQKFRTYSVEAHFDGDWDVAQEVYSLARSISTLAVDIHKEPVAR
jgi:hypothetical protein